MESALALLTLFGITVLFPNGTVSRGDRKQRFGNGCRGRCLSGVTFPVKKVNTKVFYLRKANTVSRISLERRPSIVGRPCAFTTVCMGKIRGKTGMLRKRIPA